ncbi:MAG TPA: hypothetical protein VI979_01935 [archaeon]|nr:hypothetical protein [archaeon]
MRIAVVSSDAGGINTIEFYDTDKASGWQSYSCGGTISCGTSWTVTRDTAGTSTYWARVFDKAGNSNTDYVTVKFAAVTTGSTTTITSAADQPPKATIVAPSTAEAGKPFTLIGIGTDDKDVAKLELSGPLAKTYACEGTQTSCSNAWAITETATGTYTYYLYVHDNTGKVTPASKTITFTAPITPTTCTAGYYCDIDELRYRYTDCRTTKWQSCSYGCSNGACNAYGATTTTMPSIVPITTVPPTSYGRITSVGIAPLRSSLTVGAITTIYGIVVSSQLPEGYKVKIYEIMSGEKPCDAFNSASCKSITECSSKTCTTIAYSSTPATRRFYTAVLDATGTIVAQSRDVSIITWTEEDFTVTLPAETIATTTVPSEAVTTPAPSQSPVISGIASFGIAASKRDPPVGEQIKISAVALLSVDDEIGYTTLIYEIADSMKDGNPLRTFTKISRCDNSAACDAIVKSDVVEKRKYVASISNPDKRAMLSKIVEIAWCDNIICQAGNAIASIVPAAEEPTPEMEQAIKEADKAPIATSEPTATPTLDASSEIKLTFVKSTETGAELKAEFINMQASGSTCRIIYSYQPLDLHVSEGFSEWLPCNTKAVAKIGESGDTCKTTADCQVSLVANYQGTIVHSNAVSLREDISSPEGCGLNPLCYLGKLFSASEPPAPDIRLFGISAKRDAAAGEEIPVVAVALLNTETDALPSFYRMAIYEDIQITGSLSMSQCATAAKKTDTSCTRLLKQCTKTSCEALVKYDSPETRNYWAAVERVYTVNHHIEVKPFKTSDIITVMWSGPASSFVEEDESTLKAVYFIQGALSKELSYVTPPNAPGFFGMVSSTFNALDRTSFIYEASRETRFKDLAEQTSAYEIMAQGLEQGFSVKEILDGYRPFVVSTGNLNNDGSKYLDDKYNEIINVYDEICASADLKSDEPAMTLPDGSEIKAKDLCLFWQAPERRDAYYPESITDPFFQNIMTAKKQEARLMKVLGKPEPLMVALENYDNALRRGASSPEIFAAKTEIIYQLAKRFDGKREYDSAAEMYDIVATAAPDAERGKQSTQALQRLSSDGHKAKRILYHITASTIADPTIILPFPACGFFCRALGDIAAASSTRIFIDGVGHVAVITGRGTTVGGLPLKKAVESAVGAAAKDTVPPVAKTGAKLADGTAPALPAKVAASFTDKSDASEILGKIYPSVTPTQPQIDDIADLLPYFRAGRRENSDALSYIREYLQMANDYPALKSNPTARMAVADMIGRDISLVTIRDIVKIPDNLKTFVPDYLHVVRNSKAIGTRGASPRDSMDLLLSKVSARATVDIIDNGANANKDSLNELFLKFIVPDYLNYLKDPSKSTINIIITDGDLIRKLQLNEIDSAIMRLRNAGVDEEKIAELFRNAREPESIAMWAKESDDKIHAAFGVQDASDAKPITKATDTGNPNVDSMLKTLYATDDEKREIVELMPYFQSSGRELTTIVRYYIVARNNIDDIITASPTVKQGVIGLLAHDVSTRDVHLLFSYGNTENAMRDYLEIFASGAIKKYADRHYIARDTYTLLAHGVSKETVMNVLTGDKIGKKSIDEIFEKYEKANIIRFVKGLDRSRLSSGLVRRVDDTFGFGELIEPTNLLRDTRLRRHQITEMIGIAKRPQDITMLAHAVENLNSAGLTAADIEALFNKNHKLSDITRWAASKPEDIKIAFLDTLEANQMGDYLSHLGPIAPTQDEIDNYLYALKKSLKAKSPGNYHNSRRSIAILIHREVPVDSVVDLVDNGLRASKGSLDDYAAMIRRDVTQLRVNPDIVSAYSIALKNIFRETHPEIKGLAQTITDAIANLQKAGKTDAEMIDIIKNTRSFDDIAKLLAELPAPLLQNP